MANQDKKEIERKLSKDEEKRLREFEELTLKMEAEGYAHQPLTVSIVKANMYVLIAAIPVLAIGILLFFLCSKDADLDSGFLSNPLLFVGTIFLLTVVHELVHGITWACFARNHFKDIAFGFMVQYLTPYCACKVPLDRKAYITGALMPLIALGIIPFVISLISGSFPLLIISIIMILAAGGDVMIVLNVLKYKSDAKHIVYIDHPTQAGGVIFERN